MTREEKQLLKIYNKTQDETIKKVLGVLLDEEEVEEPKKEELVVEKPKEEEPTKVEPKEQPKQEEPKEVKKEEPQKDFESLFNQLSEQFKVVVDEVKTLKEQKVEQIGIKAKPKQPSEENSFDSIFDKLNSRNQQY